MSATVKEEGREVALANSTAADVRTTPMQMLERLIEGGGTQNIELMGKMLDLQERWEAGEARKRAEDAKATFADAMSAMRAELPPIIKDGKGNNQSRYATLAALTGALDEVISDFGLSYRFKTDSSQPGQVIVTCIVSHAAGHTEETTLSAAPDGSGSKNAIQSIGSTLTYLRRYTLEAAFGLAASIDDDGQAYQRKEGEKPRQIEQSNAPAAAFDVEKVMASIASARMGGRAELQKLIKRIRDDLANGSIPQAYADQIRAACVSARDSLKEMEGPDADR